MAGSSERVRTDAELRERRRKALQLKIHGATYEQIADQLVDEDGKREYYDKSHARRDVSKALREITEQESKEFLAKREEEKILSNERLDLLLRSGLLEKATSGSDNWEVRLKAIDRVIRVEERRARLLGLDAPVKQEVTGTDGSPLMISLANDLRAMTDEELRALVDGRPPGDPSGSGA